MPPGYPTGNLTNLRGGEAFVIMENMYLCWVEQVCSFAKHVACSVVRFLKSGTMQVSLPCPATRGEWEENLGKSIFLILDIALLR